MANMFSKSLAGQAVDKGVFEGMPLMRNVVKPLRRKIENKQDYSKPKEEKPKKRYSTSTPGDSEYLIG